MDTEFLLEKIDKWCVLDVFHGKHDLRWTDSWFKNDLLLDGWLGFSLFFGQEWNVNKIEHFLRLMEKTFNLQYWNLKVMFQWFANLHFDSAWFCGKNPVSLWNSTPTSTPTKHGPGTSSEFAHQCHSTNSHSQDVNGTSRKCSPLYLVETCEQLSKKSWEVEMINANWCMVRSFDSTDIPLYSAHVVWKKSKWNEQKPATPPPKLFGKHINKQ